MRNPYKLYFLIFVFFIFTTYATKEKNKKFAFFFPIKKIQIENTLGTDLIKLKSDLDFLMNTSLFFLEKENFLKTINKHDFILNIQLKKIYPNTLKLLIAEKIPLAITEIDKKKFYIIKDNKKISFIDHKIYKDLPSVFGKYKNFNIFYTELKKNNFKINKIKAFYYLDVGRWDIVLKNERIIKFPEKNYLDLFPKINLILDDSNFSMYKVFDFRIKDQLILQ